MTRAAAVHVQLLHRLLQVTRGRARRVRAVFQQQQGHRAVRKAITGLLRPSLLRSGQQDLPSRPRVVRNHLVPGLIHQVTASQGPAQHLIITGAATIQGVPERQARRHVPVAQVHQAAAVHILLPAAVLTDHRAAAVVLQAVAAVRTALQAGAAVPTAHQAAAAAVPQAGAAVLTVHRAVAAAAVLQAEVAEDLTVLQVTVLLQVLPAVAAAQEEEGKYSRYSAGSFLPADFFRN